MHLLNSIFPNSKPILGMIHVSALSGTPANKDSIQEIIDKAVEEALLYKKGGIDALIIENMHDTPYLKNRVGPEIIAEMSIIGRAVKEASELPCGVQILAAANKEALAVAKAANLDFIRAEGFVFGHLADEGWIDANAPELLRYRKMIGAEHISIFTDIKKKHSSHVITADVDIVETAKAAHFFRSDGLIITGKSTAQAANLEEIKAVKKHCALPVFIGSGINIDNVEQYLSIADALIVGSWFKEKGHWANPIDLNRVTQFMKKVNSL